MKIFISADIEGVSGVVHGEHTSRDGREHDLARRLMTNEVNASILGALQGGADDAILYIGLSHNASVNIDQAVLDKLLAE